MLFSFFLIGCWDQYLLVRRNHGPHHAKSYVNDLFVVIPNMAAPILLLVWNRPFRKSNPDLLRHIAYIYEILHCLTGLKNTSSTSSSLQPLHHCWEWWSGCSGECHRCRQYPGEDLGCSLKDNAIPKEGWTRPCPPILLYGPFFSTMRQTLIREIFI